MDMRESSQAIDERAADWAVRVDAGSLSNDDQAELKDWLGGDSRRLGAFARARAVIAQLRIAPVEAEAAAGLAPEPAAAPEEAPPRSWTNRRRFLLSGGLAAALVAGGLVVGRQAGLFAGGTEYATAKGEIRLITLDDGSSVTLNTDSAIRVFSETTRHLVELLRGEALFSVVADGKRPFVVRGGDLTILGTGARFAVSMLPRRPVEILVHNGRIELGGGRGKPVTLSANMVASAPVNRPVAVREMAVDEVTRQTAWVEGMLFFQDTPLDEALGEFGRYTDTPILLDDPSLARETVTGMFAASDPAGFTAAVSRALNLRMRRADGALHLGR